MQRVPLIVMTAIGTVFVSVLLSVQFAVASCGLEYCPAPGRTDSAIASQFTGQVLVRYVDLELPNQNGYYYENVIRGEYRGFSNWTVGAWAASALLMVDGEMSSGLNNPVVFVERRFAISKRWTTSLALQFEFPLGNSQAGIASDHMEFLPYVGLGYGRSAVQIQAQAGLGLALSSGHGHTEETAHMQYVNPHADRELLTRVIGHYALGRFSPGAQLSARFDMEDVSENLISVTALSNYRVTAKIDLGVQAEMPISSGHWFGWRVGTGMKLQF